MANPAPDVRGFFQPPRKPPQVMPHQRLRDLPENHGPASPTLGPLGCLSRKAAFAMVLQLALSAQQKWHRLNGPKRLAQVIEGAQFRNDIQEV